MKKTSRTFKRFAAITSASLLAACMVAPMASFAETEETTYTITIDSTIGGHTYEAYQIFAGTLKEETNATTGAKTTVLSDIKWGSGINADGQTALLNGSDDAAALAKTLTDANAKDFAKNASKFLTNPAGSDDYDESKYEISGLKPGYYLIKDADDSLDEEEGAAYTSYILRVVSDVEVEPKSGTVTSDKKVIDTNESTGVTTDWQDSADYAIGDSIPFKLSAKIAADYDNYTKYQLVFHDKEENGLAFKAESVKVYVNGNEITTGFSVVTEGLSDGCTFEVRFADLKEIDAVTAGSVITVEYKSVLDTDAVIGSVGNANTSYVTYSNNPNDETGGETGKTVDDTVRIFTYKTIINKVNENGEPLTGADFELQKLIKSTEQGVADTWETIEYVETTSGTIFTFNGLDDGTYKLTEIVTPGGYNTIKPITFDITATHDVLNDDPQLTELEAGDALSGKVDKTDGSITATIKNEKGSSLPSTGGIGTTVFYLGGGAMVAVAGIYLISKKRMKNTQE